MSPEDLRNRFAFHSPATEKRRLDHEKIRDLCHGLAQQINALCPDSRELSLAVTHLEETMFWANAAVARAPQDAARPDPGE